MPSGSPDGVGKRGLAPRFSISKPRPPTVSGALSDLGGHQSSILTFFCSINSLQQSAQVTSAQRGIRHTADPDAPRQPSGDRLFPRRPCAGSSDAHADGECVPWGGVRGPVSGPAQLWLARPPCVPGRPAGARGHCAPGPKAPMGRSVPRSSPTLAPRKCRPNRRATGLFQGASSRTPGQPQVAREGAKSPLRSAEGALAVLAIGFS